MKQPKLRKILAALLALTLMGTLMLSGCSTDAGTPSQPPSDSSPAALSGKDIVNTPLKIAFIPISTAGANVSLDKAAAENIRLNYPNLDVQFFDSQYDATTQIQIISECIAQKFDAIIMEVTDGVALGTSIKEAEAAGIPVITFNMGADTVHTLHIENNSYNSGWTGGKAIAEKLGGKGKVVLLDVPAELKAMAHFGTGFEEYIQQNTDIEIIDTQNVPGFSQEEANKIMRDLLTKHEQIDAVYAVSDDEAMGVLQAIEAAGRGDDGILIWGSTGIPAVLNAIEDGKIYGTCWEDVYSLAKIAINFALYAISSGVNSVSAGYTETPMLQGAFIAVTQDNVKAIKPQTHWPDFS